MHGYRLRSILSEIIYFYIPLIHYNTVISVGQITLRKTLNHQQKAAGNKLFQAQITFHK